MKNYDYEVVVLAKRVELDNGIISYIPIDVISGSYNSGEDCFIDNNGNRYAYIINNVDIVFFGRKNMADLKEKYKCLSPFMIKKILLHCYKKDSYCYCSENDSELNVPLILRINKKKKSVNYLDYDMKCYYLKNYPSYYNYLCSIGEIESDFILQEIGLNNLDKDTCLNLISEEVINGKRDYRAIVNAFYKHLTTQDNANILINTDDTEECLEIVRLVSYVFNLPVVNIDFNSMYNVETLKNKLCGVMEQLLEQTNNDVISSQLSVIVLNDIDGILDDSIDSKQMQDLIIDVINEGGKFTIGEEQSKFTFDNILVIGIGNWKNVYKIGFINNSIVEFDKENLVKFDMRKKLCDKFSDFIEIRGKEDIKKKNLQKKD